MLEQYNVDKCGPERFIGKLHLVANFCHFKHPVEVRKIIELLGNNFIKNAPQIFILELKQINYIVHSPH